MYWRVACFLYVLLVVGSKAHSATYYVDSLKGDDANSGSTSDSPWRSLAKVNSFKFAPGDILLLRRGRLWREQLDFPSSGSAEAPITIDAYGDGEQPLISGSDLVDATSWTQSSDAEGQIWKVHVPAQPNVVLFDGTKGHRKSSVAEIIAPLQWSWNSGTLYVFSPSNPAVAFIHPGVEAGVRPSGLNLTGISNVLVKNIAISGANAVPYAEGAGIWAITVHLEGPTPGNLEMSNVTIMNGAGDGIHLENADHCTVNAVLVHDNEGAGIELYHSNGKFPITSANITNNQVHHNGFNGIFIVGCPRAERCRSVVYPDGLVVTGVRITGNTVHDNGAGIYLHETNDSLVAGNTAYSNTNTSRRGEGYCVGLSGSSSNIVEKNNCHHARLSGIELSIDTGKPPFGSSHNTVRYNSVHDDGSHGIFTNYIPSQGNKILYNVIYNHPLGSCIMANYTGHEIYNNTCYNSKIGIHLYVSPTTRETGNISIKNNLVVRSSEYQVLVEKGVNGPLEFSNNLYFPDGHSAFNWKDTVVAHFSEWQTVSGLDKDSLIGDPRLASAAPNISGDFALSPASLAVGRGADLGGENQMALFPSLAWPAQVKLVAQEPGRWDIGAFRHTP
jgi:parallel beta-helix repeat protein